MHICPICLLLSFARQLPPAPLNIFQLPHCCYSLHSHISISLSVYTFPLFLINSLLIVSVVPNLSGSSSRSYLKPSSDSTVSSLNGRKDIYIIPSCLITSCLPGVSRLITFCRSMILISVVRRSSCMSSWILPRA